MGPSFEIFFVLPSSSYYYDKELPVRLLRDHSAQVQLQYKKGLGWHYMAHPLKQVNYCKRRGKGVETGRYENGESECRLQEWNSLLEPSLQLHQLAGPLCLVSTPGIMHAHPPP